MDPATAIVLTSSAAQAVRDLPASLRTAVGTYLRGKFPEYAQAHDPAEIRGLDGKFWVVEPDGAEKLVTLVITHQDQGRRGTPEYVVTAVIPEFGDPSLPSAGSPDPSDVALGAEILRLRPTRK